ncbi:Dolichyl-diphosphooligosaccharide--protein glycosyltransferase subunit WBP1 [Sporodiniella umbellata]|nr:Dolichyl-diphosphooligosaccharide--protein glycosyltransferase subunit WBP1 [Sporodiniella umbellata]
MRNFCSLVSLFVIGLLATVASTSAVGENRVLVLLDALADMERYSQFWDQLRERGLEPVIKEVSDETTSLYYFGESMFSHIIHFAPQSTQTSSHLSPMQLVEFVKGGGNMLVAAGVEVSDNVRALAAEFDIEFESEKVFDHQQFIGQDPSLISTLNVVGPAAVIDRKQLTAPVLFSGIGLTVGKNPFSHAILNAESSAFVSDVYEKKAGTEKPVTLVGALQARNSARVAITGSLDLFSNQLMDSKASKSGNVAFIDQLCQWVFQEKGVLKVVDHKHHKEGEEEQRDWYRVKDEIVYSVDIAELKDGHWVPFHANDVQLEIIMLDPYIRTTLKQVSSQTQSGKFEARIKLPDVYGIFTFKINYKRAGLTYLTVEDQVSIRPFRHNEYPRFLTAAYPYYAATGSMVVGFILFSAVWLATFGKDGKKTK